MLKLLTRAKRTDRNNVSLNTNSDLHIQTTYRIVNCPRYIFPGLTKLYLHIKKTRFDPYAIIA